MTGLDNIKEMVRKSEIELFYDLFINRDNEGRERGQEVSLHDAIKDNRLTGKNALETIYGSSESPL